MKQSGSRLLRLSMQAKNCIIHELTDSRSKPTNFRVGLRGMFSRKKQMGWRRMLREKGHKRRSSKGWISWELWMMKTLESPLWFQMRELLLTRTTTTRSATLSSTSSPRLMRSTPWKPCFWTKWRQIRICYNCLSWMKSRKPKFKIIILNFKFCKMSSSQGWSICCPQCLS